MRKITKNGQLSEYREKPSNKIYCELRGDVSHITEEKKEMTLESVT